MALLRDVVFMSQVWAEAMIPEGNESIISITDRGAAPADLNQGWRSILRVQFDDVDPDEASIGEFERDLIPISQEQAEEIAAFINAAAQHSATLVVHCRFGQSRSPGVAKAVCQHFRLDFPPEFRSQNNFVYRLVLEAISSQAAHGKRRPLAR